MVKTRSLHTCEACGTEYADAQVAALCEAQPGLPLPACVVGQFVAFGGYGWWKRDASWALTDSTPYKGPQRTGHPRSLAAGNPEPRFARYRGEPDETPCGVGAASWAPIFRVAGFRPCPSMFRTAEGFMRHEAQRVVVWPPRHMNRQSGPDPGHNLAADLAAQPGSLRMEAFGYLGSDSRLFSFTSPDMLPDTDDEQEARFQAVAAYVAKGGHVEYFGPY